MNNRTEGAGGIAVILPRGEAIRNLVYTHALERVAEEVPLSVLSVVPNQSIWELMEKRYANLFPLRNLTDRWIVRFTREILDLIHGRWLWSKGAQARWEWRDREASTPMTWLKRNGKKLAGYPFLSRRGLEVLTAFESLASRRFRTSDYYIDLYRKLRPSLVFNGSHVHSQVALPAIHAARELGLPTATFIFSWDNLTSQGRIFPPYDYYLVWNERLRDDLLSIYRTIEPEQVFVTGTPQFDFHFRQEFELSREEFCARVGADPRRPIVLYSTGMANHVIGEPWVIEQIADLLGEMTDLGSPQLLVRILPKGPQEVFDDVKRRRPDILFPAVQWEQNWLTPTLEDAYLLSNTLRHSAVGLNIASTISLELCMFDKPVINVGFPPPHLDPTKEFDYTRYYQFEHYRPIVESGAIELAGSREELRVMIRRALQEPAARKSWRAALLQNFFAGTLDGKSSVRLAQTLIDLTRSATRPR